MNLKDLMWRIRGCLDGGHFDAQSRNNTLIYVTLLPEMRTRATVLVRGTYFLAPFEAHFCRVAQMCFDVRQVYYFCLIKNED